MTSETQRIERYRGCLLGLAAGDALGTTLEFMSPGTFPLIDDIVGGGPYDLEPGQWTDDIRLNGDQACRIKLSHSVGMRWSKLGESMLVPFGLQSSNTLKVSLACQ